MEDVWGLFLGMPHGTTPAAVTTNKTAVDVRLTWTDFYEAGDYVVPNVLSPRDLVSRHYNMDETVLHRNAGTNKSSTCVVV